MTDTDIEELVWDAIGETIYEFRKQPHNFFTESDIVSYLWMLLYKSRLEAETKDGKTLYLVHREYPTNFRYHKAKMMVMDRPYLLEGEMSVAEKIAAAKIDSREAVQESEGVSSHIPAALLKKIGSRGHYDLVVLSPKFVKSISAADAWNKDVRILEPRYHSSKIELLFALEFKYIINDSPSWKTQIEIDNKKLLWAKEYGNAQHSVNLVFCNMDARYKTDYHELIASAQKGISAAFIQSFYDKDGKRNTPRPHINTEYALRQIRD